MKLFFLGQFPSSMTIKNSNGKIDSLYRDSQAIIAGLGTIGNNDVIVVTSPDVASFPKGKLFFGSFYDSEDNVYSVSNLNLPVLKQFWTSVAMVRNVVRRVSGKERFVVMIPYMVYRHVLTTRILKYIYRDRVCICTIIPDIFFSKKKVIRFVNRKTEEMASKSDCFVLYTAKMSDYLQLDKSKCIVIEGFKNIPERLPCPPTEFQVTYTGSLAKEYGITRLVDAMALLHDYPITLHLYGDGTAVPYIQEAINKSRNIVYHGLVPKETAIEAIYNSSCLINPRSNSDGEFVEYSFPSKDIEYLGTGIPSVLCKLSGMPPEYYGHFVDAGSGTAEELARAILTVYNMPEEERKQLGLKSKQFVIDRMDYQRQAKSIVELVSKVTLRGFV